MRISVHTLDGTIFSGEAEKLIAKTTTGEITVLDGHLPLLTLLRGPEIEIIEKGGKQNTIPLRSGFLEVRPESEVVVLAESAVY